MSDLEKPICPECNDQVDLSEAALDRRDFIRVGGSAVTLATLSSLGLAPSLLRADTTKEATPAKAGKTEKPAEELIRELFQTLTNDQKSQLVYPWDHKRTAGGRPTRLGMYNAPIFRTATIGKVYTKPQQELVDRILHAISSGDDGYRRLSRGGNFDGSGSLQNCGAYIFGDPSGDKKFSWVFAGHHLTVRCDGNSEEGAAFGGPMYYGHSPQGYSRGNLFYYQTRSVLSVFDALSEGQRKKAVVKGSPGELEPSIRFKKKAEERPGIPYAELSKDQKELVEKVMRDILSPYRKEDVDEVMEIVKKNGGMEKIQLAFYPDPGMNDKEPWHFWRLEGPGFVWNYRVLPHVHTYVNISSKLA